MTKLTSWFQPLRYLSPSGLLRPFWLEAAKHLYRILFDSKYRRYIWLCVKYGGTPRFHQRKIRVFGWKLIVPDVASFFSAYHEIFLEEIYDFPTEKRNPVILDCGANIGISIFYFKQKFPESKIIAYEADPAIFTIAQNNILNNKLSGVELHNKAIWSLETTVQFNSEGADGGRINIGSDRNLIDVQTVSLSSILRDHSFDFIKIDIEGAEVEALKDCDEYLPRLRYVFVEFHSFIKRRQELGSLISRFELNGFRVHVHPPFTSKKPFHGAQERDGMDMQLNLFFWKDTHEAS